ncbi:hypothetical protein AB0D67_36140 [Streptosporangium sp. NPDC048047]|uniref:hypothetical protein n=1 Tax=Streptosporangium sp. NPDC048047 TaxID=3155748 RepID=UPI00341390BA
MTACIEDPYGGFHRHPDGTFRKTMPTDRARREVIGHRTIRDHMPVAALLGSITSSGEHTLIYQDVFATGRCGLLLADLITAADRDPRRVPEVIALIDAVCDGWRSAAARTGGIAPIGACQPGLYIARLAPGGRLDNWYGRLPPFLLDNGAHVAKLDFPGLLIRLRHDFSPGALCMTALTQGDPTEPNIAAPLCWLDYEHAGRNTLAGEAAVLLWYLLAMGGWLVPRYKPRTHARTTHIRAAAVLPPAMAHLRTYGDRVEVAGTLRAGAGRRAAIDALLRRLSADVGSLIGAPGSDPMAALRPWLTLRIMGVIPLSAMSPADAAVCLAKLSQALDPNISLEHFAATEKP